MNRIPPILLLAFNRPRYVQKVIECLREVRPNKLYVSIDGPRTGNSEDAEKQIQIKEVLNTIDWNCRVTIRHLKNNKGCKLGVSSAIDWFFEQEESGIILEDDCLPDPTFFPFCSELLERYKAHEQVMSIGGSNLIKGSVDKASYFFTSTPQCWGWATWRRSWKKYDVQMKDWPTDKSHALLDKKLHSSKAVRYWSKIFDRTHSDQIDTWDYQWVYAIFKNGGLCINPNANMITNIGFDTDATHTKLAPLDQAFHARTSVTFPLSHPERVILNRQLDQKLQNTLYLSSKWNYYLSLILGTIKHRLLL